jgi:sulfur carrier protein
MKILINGETVDLEGEMTITEFLRSRGVTEALVAVEHNLRFVRRGEWSETRLQEDDRLEVVRILGGG